MTQQALLCVYYKVDTAVHASLAPRVAQMQGQLMAGWPGVRATALQRPEATHGVETWMETYSGEAAQGADFEAALAQAAALAGLPRPRHHERFVPLR